MHITFANSNFERQPLISPFGFKGGYLSELWQSVAYIESENGASGLGLGTQSALWSDSAVFSENAESASNSIMYLMTAYALELLKGHEFDNPLDALEYLFPQVHDYGKALARKPNLRPTFALNALVAVDNAIWQLFAAEKKTTNFDKLIPESLRPALTHKHDKIACSHLITYNSSIEMARQTVESGVFFLKIKIGADPNNDGDRDKMLRWDIARMEDIHKAVGAIETPYTDCGKTLYYLDANGRYDTKERLFHLLERLDAIGALSQVAILEEPFAEECDENVADIPARVTADESAHSDADALARIEQGYTAIALKPIAKTMSMSLKIAKLAHDRNIPCFCADLTVNPILIDWNKNVAARLGSFPGLKIGMFETNGHQNYLNWEEMLKDHPCFGAPWTVLDYGVFHLGDDFYESSGGIFQQSNRYLAMAKLKR